MKKIKDILEKTYNNLELRKSIVPLFIGNPGLGKTKLIEEFAESKKAKLVELITSQMSPFEISGIAMPDKESKKMTYFNFDKLEDLKDGDILFFDELLNGNPVVLNACLTILEQRRFISGKPLPNIMIVSAANPQGMAPLTPQIKERFIWYNTVFDAPMWKDYMFKKYNVTESIVSKLCKLIQEEKFTSNNFYTPRSIDKAINMILNNIETPYKNTILPILSELIKNELGSPIKLSEEIELQPNEMISWLDLIRYKKDIKFFDRNPIEEPFKGEILIYDSDREDRKIIGEISNLKELEKMFYLNENLVKKLEDGELISPSPGSWAGGSVLFFSKK